MELTTGAREFVVDGLGCDVGLGCEVGLGGEVGLGCELDVEGDVGVDREVDVDEPGVVVVLEITVGGVGMTILFVRYVWKIHQVQCISPTIESSCWYPIFTLMINPRRRRN